MRRPSPAWSPGRAYALRIATYPKHYLVNDRPVVIVATDDGGADCLVLDWRSGSFVPDRTYFSRTLPDRFADVDAITAEAMDEIVARLRAEIVERLAVRLGAEPPEPREAPTATPPFDGDRVEWSDGLVVHRPKLLVRAQLDARLGAPIVEDASGGDISATYLVGDGHCLCDVTAGFESSSPRAEASSIRFTPARPGRGSVTDVGS